MASEREKMAYLEEHLSYEVVMLNYTFMRLMTLQPSTSEGATRLQCLSRIIRRPRAGTLSIFF